MIVNMFSGRRFYDRIVCRDGVSLSVQAGEDVKSEPRTHAGPFQSVEIGFIEDENGNMLPSYALGMLAPYSDGSGEIWEHVPAHVVVDFIARHGGKVSGDCPPLASDIGEEYLIPSAALPNPYPHRSYLECFEEEED